MVRGTPDLSPIILLLTNVEGDLVGNGPSVSELVTEQLDDEPEPEPELEEDELVEVLSSLLQFAKIGAATAVTPAKPKVFKKSFLLTGFIMCIF